MSTVIILLLLFGAHIAFAFDDVHLYRAKRQANTALRCYSTKASGSIQCSYGQLCAAWYENPSTPISECRDPGHCSLAISYNFCLIDSMQSGNVCCCDNTNCNQIEENNSITDDDQSDANTDANQAAVSTSDATSSVAPPSQTSTMSAETDMSSQPVTSSSPSEAQASDSLDPISSTSSQIFIEADATSQSESQISYGVSSEAPAVAETVSRTQSAPAAEPESSAEPQSSAEPMSSTVAMPGPTPEALLLETGPSPSAEPSSITDPDVDVIPLIEPLSITYPFADPYDIMEPQVVINPLLQAPPMTDSMAEPSDITDPKVMFIPSLGPLPIGEPEAELSSSTEPISISEAELEPAAEPQSPTELTPTEEPSPVAEALSAAEPEPTPSLAAMAETVPETEPVPTGEPETMIQSEPFVEPGVPESPTEPAVEASSTAAPQPMESDIVATVAAEEPIETNPPLPSLTVDESTAASTQQQGKESAVPQSLQEGGGNSATGSNVPVSFILTFLVAFLLCAFEA